MNIIDKWALEDSKPKTPSQKVKIYGGNMFQILEWAIEARKLIEQGENAEAMNRLLRIANLSGRSI